MNESVPSDLALSALTGATGIINAISLLSGPPVDRSNANDMYRTALCIGPDHPCLPGHFPGQPLVPGVLMLDHVAQALRHWRNQRLARVREVKFLAPLYPGKSAELELADASGLIRFELRHEGNVLARGVIEGAA